MSKTAKISWSSANCVSLDPESSQARRVPVAGLRSVEVASGVAFSRIRGVVRYAEGQWLTRQVRNVQESALVKQALKVAFDKVEKWAAPL